MRDAPEKQTVLIVDDTPDNITVLMETLKEDHALIAAINGEKALVLAAEKRPDLILLDVMMPGIDGYEVCKRLKEDEATRDIPVIFVTAKGDIGDEMRGFALGAVDFIRKPFNPPVVQARVAAHLELVRARAQLQQQNALLLENAKLREDVERITRHDLKSPLNSIIGIPQILQMELTDSARPDILEMLRSLEQDGYKMLNMINLSLDLYKMETGSYTVRTEEVDLVPLLRKCVAENATIAEIKEIDTELRLDGARVEPDGNASFPVLGEELLCYSLLANLIKNGLEAAPAQSTLSIALTRGETASIAVHNMGAVPKDVRETFFDKYATSGKAEGTGLGTYSARLIAQTQGGDIAMQTGEETGTTITVTLPR